LKTEVKERKRTGRKVGRKEGKQRGMKTLGRREGVPLSKGGSSARRAAVGEE